MLSTKHPNLHLYHNLKKYYINLDSRVDRREYMQSQVGNDFQRVSAIVGKDLTNDQIAEKFDLAYSKKRYNVDLTKGQIAVTLSHFEVYKQVVADQSIAEDD